MAKEANVYARVDVSVKEQAEIILGQLGMPMSNAINLFLNQIVLRRGIPFDVTLPGKTPLAVGTLTDDEYYAEIKRGYNDCVAGRVRPAEEVFRDIEAEFGL